jgi:hypothetical protein
MSERGRCHRTFVPFLERLESRDQPTAVVTQNGALLSILGSPGGRDVIRIGDDGQGNIAVLVNPLVTPQIFHGITAIRVQTPTGSASVHYDLLGTFSGTRIVQVNGTGSKDIEFFTNNNELLPNSTLSLSAQVSGGSRKLLASTGADPDQGTVNLFTADLGLTLFTPFQNGILRFGPHTGSDLALGANLNINLSGGQGSNVIGVAYEGIVQGTLTVREQANGGAKKDQVAGLIGLLGDTTGTVNAGVGVSPGEDTISLRILEILNSGLGSLFTPIITGRLNGGPLKSVTLRTVNVTVLNSSSDTVVSTFSSTFPSLFPTGGSGTTGVAGVLAAINNEFEIGFSTRPPTFPAA